MKSQQVLSDWNDIGEATATILFVDLVGSSDVAGILKQDDYNTYLHEFQSIVEEGIAQMRVRIGATAGDSDIFLESSVTGDQGYVCLSSDFGNVSNEDIDGTKLEAIQSNIGQVIGLALWLNYRWLRDKQNRGQIEQEKKPHEIAIGINTGKVNVRERRANDGGLERKAEGFAINLAKRIEGESRKGKYSGIFVGESTYGAYYDTPGENPIRFVQQQEAPLKGIASRIRVYELAFANVEDSTDEAILQIPNDWLPDGEIDADPTLRSLKKLFMADQNPWLGNIYCNHVWSRLNRIIDGKAELIESDQKESDFQALLDMTRKLVEIDKGLSAWKIYFGQIAIDYLKYGSRDSGDDLFDRNQVLAEDLIEILKALVSNEPYELDARLCLGRLQIVQGDKSEAITELQRIILWDEKYQEAYFYCAVAVLLGHSDADDSGQISAERRALGLLDKLVEVSNEDDLRLWQPEISGEPLLIPVVGAMIEKGWIDKS